MNAQLSKENLNPFNNLPKVELHAHLNGSLSHNTIKKLIDLKKLAHDSSQQDFSGVINSSGNLSECFKLFSLIHNLTDTPEAIHMATCDVIKEFYEDDVFYLELRTTPKQNNYMDQKTYVDVVLKAINTTVSALNDKISVKLILSLDRKRSVSSAEETVKLAESYYTSSESVVGLDLSGDPTAGDIKDFIPFLERAKAIGLKLAMHTAEVPNCDDEVKEVLKLEPHRLGHGTFLHPNKGGCAENFNLLKKLKIPLEICLTSNIMSKTVSSYRDHHFPLFKDLDYPCVLCTDDKGVFNTSLSKEYYLASQYYSLPIEQLYNFSYNAIEHIFASESEKQKLRKQWKLKYPVEFSSDHKSENEHI